MFNNLHLGTHTIAVVNGPESRETLESSFKEIFDEVNDIIKNGYITVSGKRVDIEMFLGGDYKVINIIQKVTLKIHTLKGLKGLRLGFR